MPISWIPLSSRGRSGSSSIKSLSRACPIKFVAGEWVNESDENIIESVIPPIPTGASALLDNQ
jgi:hypothetical protein